MLYNWRILAGTSHPNISSWAVWGFLTVLNFATIRSLTGDWVKSLLPAANSGMCILSAIFIFRYGSIQNLSTIDQVCFWIGAVAAISRLVFKLTSKSTEFAASFAQVLLQISLVIGFIPTLSGTWRHPSSEPWFPWLLWTLCFSAQFFAVKFTWRGKYIDYLYPVNMALFHGAVTILAIL